MELCTPCAAFGLARRIPKRSKAASPPPRQVRFSQGRKFDFSTCCLVAIQASGLELVAGGRVKNREEHL